MIAPLSISRLRLTDFRNYAALDLVLDVRCVAFAGPNGAGKTNLLEAISLLAPGRGLRRAALPDIVRAGAPAWGVGATLLRGGEEVEVATGSVQEAPNSRVVRIDGAAAPQTALGALAPMVWLTPAQDRLFAGPPGDRRRFLDRFALAAFPDHGAVCSRYERALRDRQRLLDETRASGVGADLAWLDALEAELALRGAEIARARAETVRRLAHAIAARPEGAFPRARMALAGDLEQRFTDGAAAADVEADYRAALARSRGRDAAAGRTLIGPHRTDLEVFYAAKDQPAALCSTGEQKALLTGIVLAHASALARNGPAPLVLLDEAAAHLDPDRRAALAGELQALKVQAFLTGVERRLFEGFGSSVQLFAVDAGAVIPA
jgi:DNA replication and repair protein RecF